MDATPKDCILAPVSSLDDLDDIKDTASLFGVTGSDKAWVGVIKSKDDLLANDSPPESYANWFNLGTYLNLDRVTIVWLNRAVVLLTNFAFVFGHDRWK